MKTRLPGKCENAITFKTKCLSLRDQKVSNLKKEERNKKIAYLSEFVENEKQLNSTTYDCDYDYDGLLPVY